MTESRSSSTTEQAVTDEELDRWLSGAHEPAPACSAQIREHCTRDLEPARLGSLERRRAVSVITSLAVVVALGALLSTQSSASPSDVVWFGTAGWLGVQLALVGFGVGRRRGGASGGQVAMIVGVPLLLLIYLTSISVSQPLASFVQNQVELQGTFRCGVTCLVVGGAAMAVLLRLWRFTDAFTPALTGALAGLGGALTAIVPVGLACPCSSCWHFWIGHALSAIVLAAAGAVLGRTFLAP